MKTWSLLVITVLVAILFIPPALGAPANTTVIPKFTVIPLMLDDPLSSKITKVGDRFESHCVSPKCGGFPSMTTFIGVITVAKPKQGSNPGSLNAKWTEAVLPNGTRVVINAVLSTPEGMPKEPPKGGQGNKSAQRKGAKIGARIGGLAGGFGGLILGGAAGYGAGSASKGKGADIEIKEGTRYYIMLTQPVTIPIEPPLQ